MRHPHPWLLLMSCAIFAVSTIGCDGPPPAETQNPEASEPAQRDPSNDEPPPQGQEEPASSDVSTTETGTEYVMFMNAEYYKSGPQQGSPPDGQFPAGTNVRILQNAGSYTLVESSEGVQAYVASDAIGEVVK